MPIDPVKTSKFLSLVLRHEPQKIGITLDANGWTDVAALLDRMAAHGFALTAQDLRAIVANSDKQRFALSEDGRQIRANQGHSVAVDLDLTPRIPPPLLFHGTATRFLDAIRDKGLVKMSRQHVHLSPDEATAARVGVRHGKLVILKVQSADMHAAGHSFWLSANGVWLVDAVPPQFIEFPQI